MVSVLHVSEDVWSYRILVLCCGIDSLFFFNLVVHFAFIVCICVAHTVTSLPSCTV